MAREKIMLLCGSNITKSKFSKYREVLESIAMPGENAKSLWIANESAFKSTKKHMEQGRGSTEDLIEMIRCLRAEAPVTDEGEEIYGEEEKYLKYFSKTSWKMRAVSLIHFMLCSYDDTNYEVVGDAFKVCSEAWALMDFVESSDREANLVSLAADKEFSTLKNIWKQNLKVKPIQYDEGGRFPESPCPAAPPGREGDSGNRPPCRVGARVAQVASARGRPPSCRRHPGRPRPCLAGRAIPGIALSVILLLLFNVSSQFRGIIRNEKAATLNLIWVCCFATHLLHSGEGGDI